MANNKFLVESARITDAYMQMMNESAKEQKVKFAEYSDDDGLLKNLALNPVTTVMKMIERKKKQKTADDTKKTVEEDSEGKDINPVTGLPYNDSDDAGEPDSVEDWDRPDDVDENEDVDDVPDENGDAPIYMGDDDVDANVDDEVDECDSVGNIDANESMQADPTDNIFVVIRTNKGKWLIESAWGYREDAKDRIDELREEGLKKTDGKILSKRGLKSLGLDNEDDSCWVIGDVSSQFVR